MPANIDFVPETTSPVDFQPDELGQDYRESQRVTGLAPATPQPQLEETPQSRGFYLGFSPELPEPEGKPGAWGTTKEMLLGLQEAPGIGLGGAGEVLKATAGRIAGTGDTLESAHRAVEEGIPLPVEQAASKLTGVKGIAARFGLGFLGAVPKFAALGMFPGAWYTRAIAAGGIGGLDAQGNFNVKDAAIWSILPGVGAGTRAVVGRGLTKAIQSGATVFENRTAQAAMDILGEQAAINAVMLAADSPEIVQLYRTDPEAAKQRVGEIVGQNLGWALLGGARYAFGRSPTGAEEFIDKHKEKYADLADRMMKRRMGKAVKSLADVIQNAQEKQADFEQQMVSAEPEKGAQYDAIRERIERERIPPEPPRVAPRPPVPADVAEVRQKEGEQAGVGGSLRAAAEAQAPGPPSPNEPVAKPKVSADELVPMVEPKPGTVLQAGPDDITHWDILKANQGLLKELGIDPESIPHEDPRRRFINPVTKEQYSRLEAEAATGLKGTADAGGLDSTDLPRAKAIEERLKAQAPEEDTITVYRAGDAEEKGIKPFSSWTESKPTAEAYLDNPGFGGKTLRTETARKGLVLDADTTTRTGMGNLAEALGFERSVGDEWFDNQWRYPWEESVKVKKALKESRFNWLRYKDDFPEGAVSIMPIRETPPPAAPTGEVPPAKEPWQMTKSEWENGPPVRKGFTRLWRGEYKSPAENPTGMEGRWYSTSRETADFFAANQAGTDPTHIVYVDVPTKDLPKYDALNLPEKDRPPIPDEQAYVIPAELAATKQHWVDWHGDGHGDLVATALEQGKPVPPEVLAGYPDLKPKAPPELPAQGAPPAAPAAVAPSLYIKRANQLLQVTPEQASEFHKQYQRSQGENVSLPLYDTSGKEIGHVSPNGKVWMTPTTVLGDKPIYVPDYGEKQAKGKTEAVPTATLVPSDNGFVVVNENDDVIPGGRFSNLEEARVWSKNQGFRLDESHVPLVPKPPTDEYVRAGTDFLQPEDRTDPILISQPWRFSIKGKDLHSAIEANAFEKDQAFITARLRDVIDAPVLYSTYPDIFNRSTISTSLGGGEKFAGLNQLNHIAIPSDITGGYAASVLGHELAHLVQSRVHSKVLSDYWEDRTEGTAIRGASEYTRYMEARSEVSAEKSADYARRWYLQSEGKPAPPAAPEGLVIDRSKPIESTPEGPLTKEQLPDIIGRDPTGRIWERRGPAVGAPRVNVVPLMDQYAKKFMAAISGFVKTNPRGPEEGLIDYKNRIKASVPASQQDVPLLENIISGLRTNLRAIEQDIATERSTATRRLLDMDAEGVRQIISEYEQELIRVKNQLPPPPPEGTAEPATVKGKAGEGERQAEAIKWKGLTLDQIKRKLPVGFDESSARIEDGRVIAKSKSDGKDWYVDVKKGEAEPVTPTLPPAAETKGEVAPAVAKAQREVKKVAATEGQRPAKEVKSELVSRIEDEIDKAIDESKVTLEQDPDNPNQYTMRGPNSARYAEVEKTKGGKFSVTSGKVGYGAAGTIKATFDTMEEAKWFMKALVAQGEGNATIEIPGDGTFKIVRNGENLIDLWKKAGRIAVKETPIKHIPAGEMGKVDADEIVTTARKMYGGDDKAIAGIERQLASDQEMEPGQRELLERALSLIRESTPEAIRERKIKELTASIQTTAEDLAIARKQIEETRSAMKSANGTAKQRERIRHLERWIEENTAALNRDRKILSNLEQANKATPATPAAPAPGTKTENELERLTAKIDRGELLTLKEKKQYLKLSGRDKAEGETGVMAGPSAIEAEQGRAATPLSDDQIWQRLGERGIERGGAVDIVNNPQGPAGRLLFDPKTGKPLSIQLNRAKITTPEGLDWTLEHEAAHWFDIENQDMRAKLQGALSDAEFLSILERVKKLGYGEDVIADEITARGIQRLADQWKNRSWFERLVGNIQRFAAEKLGFKMTRKAAESTAVRALAQGLELMRRAAYDQPMPEAKAGPEAKMAEGPPTGPGQGEEETGPEQRYAHGQVAGEKIGVLRPVESINTIRDTVRESEFHGNAAQINADTDHLWWQKVDELSNDFTKGEAVARVHQNAETALRAQGMDEMTAQMAGGLYRNELWDYAVRKMNLGEPNMALFMAMHDQDFPVLSPSDLQSLSTPAAGRALRAAGERVLPGLWKMDVEYAKGMMSAAARALAVGPDLMREIVYQIGKVRERMSPEDLARFEDTIRNGKKEGQESIADLLARYGPERKAAEEITQSIPPEEVPQSKRGNVFQTVHRYLMDPNYSPADEARFKRDIKADLMRALGADLARFHQYDRLASRISDDAWLRKTEDLDRKTKRFMDREYKKLDAQAETTASAVLRRMMDIQLKPGVPNKVRAILKDFLKSSRPVGEGEYAEREFRTALGNELIAAGVPDQTASRIAYEVYQKRVADLAAARVRALERASKSNRMSSLIEDLLNTPYLAQNDPKWRMETAIRHFESVGLSRENAQTAAKIFDREFTDLFAKTAVKQAERFLKNAKPNRLTDLVKAIRLGLTDPTRVWPATIADREGFKALSPEQHQRIAELEQKVSNPDLSMTEKVDLREQMYGIFRHVGDPKGRTLRTIAEHFAATLLSGPSTVGLHIFQPGVHMVGSFLTNVAFEPRDFVTLSRALGHGIAAWYNTARFSWQKDAYVLNADKVGYLSNELKRVSEEAITDWKAKRYGKAVAKLIYGSEQYLVRMLQTSNQAGMVMKRDWALALYGSRAMRDAGFSTRDIALSVDMAHEAKRATYDTALDEGKTTIEAGAIADEAWARAMDDFFANKVGDETAMKIAESAVNDAHIIVGRLGPHISETEEGMLSRYGAHQILKITAEMRREGGVASIGSILGFGFVSVPLRLTRYYAGWGPYGLIRYGVDAWRRNRGRETLWKQSYGNTLQSEQRLREAVVGTALMLAFCGWQFKHRTSDDDALDKPFALYATGQGPKNRTLNDSWRKRGFRPYSLHVVVNGQIVAKMPITRIGEILAYPLGLAAAFDDAGWLVKEQRATAPGKPAPIGREFYSAIGTMYHLAGAQGIFQTFGHFIGLGGGADPGTSITRAILSTAGSAAAGIAVPWKSAAESVTEAIFGRPDRSSMQAAMIANVPLLNVWLNGRAVNRFGDLIGDHTWSARVLDRGIPFALRVADTPENREMYQMLLDKGASPTDLRRSQIEEKYGPLSQAQWQEFSLKSGNSLKSMVTSSLDGLKAMPADAVKDFLNRASQTANDQTAAEMGLVGQGRVFRNVAGGAVGTAPAADMRISAGPSRADLPPSPGGARAIFGGGVPRGITTVTGPSAAPSTATQVAHRIGVRRGLVSRVPTRHLAVGGGRTRFVSGRVRTIGRGSTRRISVGRRGGRRRRLRRR